MTATDARIAPGDQTRCRRCRAPIVFAEAPAGRRVAIEPNPRRFGEYVLLAWRIVRDGPRYLLGRPYIDGDPDEPRFALHRCTKGTR